MKFEIRLSDRKVYRYKSGVKVSLRKRKRVPFNVVMALCWMATAVLSYVGGHKQFAMLCFILACSFFVIFDKKARKRRQS